MLWIVGIWHACGYSQHFRDSFRPYLSSSVLMGITKGALGAFLFLSSYLLCSRHSFRCWSDAVAFYRNRAIRIMPLYLLSLATLPLAKFDMHGMMARLLSAIGVSPFLPEYRLMTLWFVATLLPFYALLPLLALERRPFVSKTAGLAVLGLFSALPFLLKVDPWLPICFAPFLLGVWCSERTVRHPAVWLFVAAASWFFLLYAPDLPSGGPVPSAVRSSMRAAPQLRNVLLSLLGFAPLLLASVPLSRIPGSDGVWRFLSYVSFSAYLFHRQVYGLIEPFLPPDGPVRIAVIECIGFPFVLAASFAMQRLGDLIAKRLRR